MTGERGSPLRKLFGSVYGAGEARGVVGKRPDSPQRRRGRAKWRRTLPQQGPVTASGMARDLRTATRVSGGYRGFKIACSAPSCGGLYLSWNLTSMVAGISTGSPFRIPGRLTGTRIGGAGESVESRVAESQSPLISFNGRQSMEVILWMTAPRFSIASRIPDRGSRGWSIAPIPSPVTASTLWRPLFGERPPRRGGWHESARSLDCAGW